MEASRGEFKTRAHKSNRKRIRAKTERSEIIISNIDF